MKERSLAKNAVYNIIYKMLNIVFPLVTSAYVARILRADSIGKVAAAQNIVSYFTLLAAMGIPVYGVKLIAQSNIKSKELSKAFSELFLINGGLSVICSFIYYILIFVCPYFDGKEILYCITGLNIVFNVINVDWFYQGIQEYGYIAIRSFIIKCISLVCLVLFVRCESDYIIYALISTSAIVGNYIFNIFRIRKYVYLSFSDLQFSKHFRHVFMLFVASVAAEIYVLADTTMLDYMCDSSTVGYYTMSMKIIRLIRSFVVAISAVFLPQLSYLYHNNQQETFYKLVNRGLHILMTTTFPFSVGLLLVADDAIITLFGWNFVDSILTTRILVISIITVAVSNYIGMQILVTIGKERITTISTISGAIVNIILNLFLIRIWYHNGAAVASVITEGIVMIIQLVLSRKYIQFHPRISKPMISVAVMSVGVIFIRLLPLQQISRLLLSCIVGAGIYCMMMLIQKDEFALNIIDKVKGVKRGIGGKRIGGDFSD